MIVKVQEDMREGLGELVRALWKATGGRAMLDALWRWQCGKSSTGHSYSVVCLGMDEAGTWALDPFTNCLKCGTPMSDDAYQQMVDTYAAMVGEYQEQEEEW